jgi:hypothetical protein
VLSNTRSQLGVDFSRTWPIIFIASVEERFIAASAVAISESYDTRRVEHIPGGTGW